MKLLFTILTNAIFGVATLTSFTANAETTTYTVKGMHCGGCEKMVSKAVCENAELKAAMKTCKVKMTDQENEIGQITFEAVETQKIEQAQIQTLLTATDERYTIIPNPAQAKNKKK